jgi:uncharacterized phage protein gp47/JayE
MAVEFKTPSEVADEYLATLKNLKPEVNTDQDDSDWVIRGKVVGGVISGLYADQIKIADDAFPQSARREAVERWLNTYFNSGFLPAQPSDGNAFVEGVTGSNLPINTELLHEPTGNTYLTTAALTLTATTGSVAIQSVNTGQAQNLLSGAPLKLQAPPIGFSSNASALSDIGNGRNEESIDEAVTRILERIRFPAKGGTENDYKTWAVEADPSVSSAAVRRYINGLGTVGVYFTAGTTDIDEAIDNDQAIVRVPSDALVEQVRQYIDDRNPLTDCLTVLKPSEIPIDVTFRVKFKAGITGATVLAGQTLTCLQLVEREIKRAIYSLPIGGRVLGSNGYVVASEIEEVVDSRLSATPYTEGETAQIVQDRQCDNLSATGFNRLLLPNEIVEPGTITIVEL